MTPLQKCLYLHCWLSICVNAYWLWVWSYNASGSILAGTRGTLVNVCFTVHCKVARSTVAGVAVELILWFVWSTIIPSRVSTFLHDAKWGSYSWLLTLYSQRMLLHSCRGQRHTHWCLLCSFCLSTQVHKYSCSWQSYPTRQTDREKSDMWRGWTNYHQTWAALSNCSSIKQMQNLGIGYQW